MEVTRLKKTGLPSHSTAVACLLCYNELWINHFSPFFLFVNSQFIVLC